MTDRFDPTVFDAPRMRELLQTMWDEATAATIEGYVDDWILATRPWGFELVDVKPPAFVWFGEQDTLVPRADAEKLRAQLSRAEMFGCPDCRHFVAIAHWPQILEQVVATRQQ